MEKFTESGTKNASTKQSEDRATDATVNQTPRPFSTDKKAFAKELQDVGLTRKEARARAFKAKKFENDRPSLRLNGHKGKNQKKREEEHAARVLRGDKFIDLKAEREAERFAKNLLDIQE